MAHKALQQCLFDVDWGELDYLMVISRQAPVTFTSTLRKRFR